MAVSLPDSRHLSDEVLQAVRLRAIHACELGFTQAEISQIIGVSPETVSRWSSAYSSKGMEGIPGDRTVRPEGTGRTLSDDQASSIQKKSMAIGPRISALPLRCGVGGLSAT